MRISVEEAAPRLEELARRACAGEEVSLYREGGPDIRLEPVPEEQWHRYSGPEPGSRASSAG